ncbi:MAG: 4Fe-4S dicluster domain-containing protein [Planctomycetes bacterium]|nr:4Fe-4S dicluster domain-containing protein [Planctomycetota bacterium]
MSQYREKAYHSDATIRLLKQAALPTHTEDFSPVDDVTRRGVMKAFMGATAALAAGMAGCERKPKRKIISRVDGPEHQKPGRVSYYSSTWMEGPRPYGMLVRTVDGRPIKVEGNPDHPVNAGVSSAAMQATILSLYDPDRLRRPTRRVATGSSGTREDVTWQAADERIVNALREAKSVLLATRSTLGPSGRDLVERFLKVCPQAQHVVLESAHDGPRRSTWAKLYGADGEWRPRFDKARVILSLDSDFLAGDGAVLENIRAFAAGRELHDENHASAEISRLYVIESAMTVTGSNADHRLRLRPSAMTAIANALRQAMAGDAEPLGRLAEVCHLDGKALAALAKDLAAHKGQALVVAGPHLPPAAHAAVALLNEALDAPGKTLEWNSQPASLAVTPFQELRAVIGRGADVVICLGVNPVYEMPAMGFEELLNKAKLSVGHDLHETETVAICTLALPSNHNLESWNDAVCRPGVESLCQPVIAPLFDTRQEAESLLRWTQALAVSNDPIRRLPDWHASVKGRWQKAPGRVWNEQLRVGGWFRPEAAESPKLDRAAAEAMANAEAKPGKYELVLVPHHSVYDGRFANNGWLQELPDPVSKIVWDNWAAVSRETAESLGVNEGDMVSVAVGGRSVCLPVVIQNGTADDVVIAQLGYGHTAGGGIAREAGGVNVAALLSAENPEVPRLAVNAELRKEDGNRRFARTQKYFSMQGRPIVLDGTLEEYRREVDFVKHKRHRPRMVDMNPPADYSKGHKWVMAIDLARCIGCGACVAACQAENNIAMVGRDQVGKSREMHWIRIDRYEDGDPDNPTVRHQPMLCQQCDSAPCESVCPVNATAHSPDGLNEMVYNRCVGTRYCSNNCPYKARRFNYLRYHEPRLKDPVQELAFNPQVTVRSVGVMEKCTFCVQRINDAKFAALNRGQAVPDGAVRTACQQACPAGAIVFGDANDPNSRISGLKGSGRGFLVLEELNTGPNVVYLARVRNPHPDLATGETKGGHHA